MLFRWSFRVQKCCLSSLISQYAYPPFSCLWYKKMRCMSCAKTSIHCPLHPWGTSDASILPNENSAPSAPGEHPVTANAEHGQQVAAQASCCCSGPLGCSGTKPIGVAAILDPPVSLFLTQRKERTLQTGTQFHPNSVVVGNIPSAMYHN